MLQPHELAAVAGAVFQLVAESEGTLKTESWTLEELYVHFAVTPGRPNYQATDEVRKALEARIESLLVAGGAGRAVNISDVRDVFLVWHELDGLDVERPLRVVIELRDFLSREDILSPLSDPAAWRAAIPLVLDRHRISKSNTSAVDDAVRPRARAVGRAAKALRARGIEPSIIAKYAGLSDEAEAVLAGQLHGLLSQIGGLRYVHAVFKSHTDKQLYDAPAQRYRMVRRPGGINSWLSKEPSYPFGYLLTLAVQHVLDQPNPLPEHVPLNELVRQLEGLARDRATLYDVEPYSMFDGFFTQGRSLVRHLRELVLFDGIFSVPQDSPDDAAQVILDLLGGLGRQDLERRIGFSIRTAANVCSAILRSGRGPAPQIFKLSDIASRLRAESPTEILAVLRSWSQPAPRVNRGFIAPHNLAKVTFPRKPLIALRAEPSEGTVRTRAYELFCERGSNHGNDRADWFQAERECSLSPEDHIAVPNRCWAASGFIRATIERLVSEDRGISDLVGQSMEKLIRRMFSDKNGRVSYGKYNDKAKGLSGDCDAAVETDSAIILIESKKEDLSVRARGGSELDILLDLADSLLKAQLQLAKQEWILRHRGELRLGAATVRWNERRIERIVISLSDHGALHSREIAMKILESFAGAQFTVGDDIMKDQVDKLARLNKNCRQLGDLESELGRQKASEGLHFFDAWFVPLGFVRFLLRGANDVPAFLVALRQIKAVTGGTLDLYAEHAAMAAHA